MSPFIKLCDVCNQVLENHEDTHDLHEHRCIRENDCLCDIVVHADCCPECNGAA